MKTLAFLIILGLASVANAQGKKTGAELLDMVVPYGDDNCFNRTTASAGPLYVSGAHAHLKAFWGYEITPVSASCDVFFLTATAVATGTGTHIPAGMKVSYRLRQAYVAFYCDGATRVNVCHLMTDVP